jgi:hypothetical protein
LATLCSTHRAVPRTSGSAPNTAVCASASITSGANAFATVTRSVITVAYGLTASVNCFAVA